MHFDFAVGLTNFVSYFILRVFQEAYDVVVSVPRRANDLMHLENFEEHKVSCKWTLRD